jgi:hypothetical protein
MAAAKSNRWGHRPAPILSSGEIDEWAESVRPLSYETKMDGQVN